jgi:adenine-specific DNA methylase
MGEPSIPDFRSFLTDFRSKVIDFCFKNKELYEACRQTVTDIDDLHTRLLRCATADEKNDLIFAAVRNFKDFHLPPDAGSLEACREELGRFQLNRYHPDKRKVARLRAELDKCKATLSEKQKERDQLIAALKADERARRFEAAQMEDDSPYEVAMEKIRAVFASESRDPAKSPRRGTDAVASPKKDADSGSSPHKNREPAQSPKKRQG